MQPHGSSPRHVKTDVKRNSEGKPRAFTLTLEREQVTLDPGASWTKADAFKWVTRGIIEQPQSFHVQPDGTVEINGEKISPQDPEGVAKLEHEINKHHDLSTTPKPSTADLSLRKATAHAHPSDRVAFHVKLDAFGHLVIECFAGEERTATGLRGLPSLMQNGLMVKPAQFHVDPLQRHVEIDGARFECTAAGARQLEAALNARYAPKLKDPSETPVEIRENPASPSGFDIRFVTLHAGARFEIKGHLDQEKLDILQDQSKCTLLKPGILFRLVPPFLLVRRRRPDGGEERVPELADLQYLRATSVELQQFFNHPLVRRGGGTGASSTPGTVVTSAAPVQTVAFRLRRNPQNKLVLWLDSLAHNGDVAEGRAFTHHNLTELQHTGTFQPHLDVTLSLDHRSLSILNQQTGEDEQLLLDQNSSDEELARASRALTAALRPPPPRPQFPAPSEPAPPPLPLPQEGQDAAAEPPDTAAAPADAPGETADAPTSVAPPIPPVVEPLPTPVSSPPLPTDSTPAPVAADPQMPPPSPPVIPGAGAARPQSTAVAPPPPKAPEAEEVPEVADPGQTLRRVFHTLAADVGRPVQDVALSLPPAFTGRRFEILSFGDAAIASVLELRAETFAGFYLTHLHEDELLLVYANRGRHIEFGRERCELQAAVSAEPDEFKGYGLLGLAQDEAGNFVFIVTRRYRAWVGSREKAYLDAAARFLTTAEVAAAVEPLIPIWPKDSITCALSSQGEG